MSSFKNLKFKSLKLFILVLVQVDNASYNNLFVIFYQQYNNLICKFITLQSNTYQTGCITQILIFFK